MATWGPIQVAASNADAHEMGDGQFGFTGTVCYVMSHTDPENASYRCSGMYWPNVTVPQGATITSATLGLYLSYLTGDDANGKIYGNLVANADEFETLQKIISVGDRPRTTAFTPWVADSIAAGGVGWYNAPDIKDVIEEIVGQGTWVSGNALALLFIANTDQVKNLYWYGWDQAPQGDYGEKLTIVYEEAPPPSAKTLVQAALISAIPLIAIPTLGQIIKFAGG